MTTMQLKKIRELNERGMTDAYIAALLGTSQTTVNKYRSDMGLPAHHCGSGWYTVRDEFGRILTQGTSVDCAQVLGIKVKTFYHRVIRSNREGDGRYVNESRRR